MNYYHLIILSVLVSLFVSGIIQLSLYINKKQKNTHKNVSFSETIFIHKKTMILNDIMICNDIYSLDIMESVMNDFLENEHDMIDVIVFTQCVDDLSSAIEFKRNSLAQKK